MCECDVCQHESMFKYRWRVRCDEFSVLNTLATLVEVLEEVTFLLILDIIVVRETFVACVRTLSHGCNLIKKVASPNVAVLDVV